MFGVSDFPLYLYCDFNGNLSGLFKTLNRKSETYWRQGTSGLRGETAAANALHSRSLLADERTSEFACNVDLSPFAGNQGR